MSLIVDVAGCLALGLIAAAAIALAAGSWLGRSGRQDPIGGSFIVLGLAAVAFVVVTTSLFLLVR